MRLNVPGFGIIEGSIKRVQPPSSEREELLKDLDKMRIDASNALVERHSAWRTYDDYYAGEHAINKNVDKTEPTGADRDKKPINLCMSTVETMIPVIRDASPMWYALDESEKPEPAMQPGGPEPAMQPGGPEPTMQPGGPMQGMEIPEAGLEGDMTPTLEESVTAYLQAFWHANNLDHVLEEVYRDMIIYGSGTMKVYWDNLAKVETRTTPILPEGIENIEEWTGEIEEETETEFIGDVVVEWLDPYNVFPDPNARNIKECRYIAIKTELTVSEIKRMFKDVDEDQLATVGGSTSGEARRRPTEQMKRRSELREVWEVYHEHGKRLTIYSGKVILWNGDNTLPGNKFPVVFFTNRRRGGYFWGFSEVGNIMVIQDFINIINYRIARFQRFAGNPQYWTNDENLSRQFTNKPGKMYFVRPKLMGGAEGVVQPLNHPSLDPQTFAHLAWLEKQIDVQSGVHDVTEGRRPQGITSGVALGILNESAQARLRLMISSSSLSLRDAGQLALDMMIEFYAERRTMSHYYGEEPVTVSITGEELGEGKLRVVVQSRGDLPLNPMAKADLAIQLYGANLIDRREALKAVNWPDAAGVVQRMESAEMAQMAQAMAGQAGGAPR